MLTPEQVNALNDAVNAAKIAEKKTGCPAGLTVAQWVQESGWGHHQPGNNCFGIKAVHGFDTQLLLTTEWFTQLELSHFLAKGNGRTAAPRNPDLPARPDGRRLYNVEDWFAKFSTLADCFAYHGNLLVNGAPYRDAFAHYQQDENLDALILNVAAHYATDPNYAESLKRILAAPQVQESLAA